MKHRINIFRTGVVLSVLSFISACTPLKMDVQGKDSSVGKTTLGTTAVKLEKNSVTTY